MTTHMAIKVTMAIKNQMLMSTNLLMKLTSKYPLQLICINRFTISWQMLKLL